MISRRRLRPHAHRLADLLEAGAAALRRAVERKPRPRPLRFPTKGELLLAEMGDAMLRRAARDLVFMREPLWLGIDRAIGPDVKIRIPSDYSPGRIDAD
jgi:hypothetical protein